MVAYENHRWKIVKSELGKVCGIAARVDVDLPLRRILPIRFRVTGRSQKGLLRIVKKYYEIGAF